MSFLAILLAAALPGSPGRAACASSGAPVLSISFSEPRAGAVLEGEQLAEIRWSGVPADVEEVELLLSLDGGRTFSLRLTEKLEADSESFWWRVPNLTAEDVTLVLRVGIEGKEILSAPGPIFRLRPNPVPARALLRWKSGEIWVDSDGDGEPDAPNEALPAAGLSYEPERMTARPHDSGAVLSPRSAATRPELARGHAASRTITEPAATAGPAALSRIPLTVPPRI